MGCDPGGKWTGIVTRVGTKVVSAVVLTRRTLGDLPDGAYLVRVCETINDHLEAALEHGEPFLAVEGIVPPNPHVRLTNVMGIIGCGLTLGAVLTTWPDAIVVRPNHHGKNGPPEWYPKEIGAGVRLGGPSEHARSAYDVAAHALRRPTGGTR